MQDLPASRLTGRIDRRIRGFTIIELMVTLAIAGVLLSVAVPNIRTFIQNNRLSSTANDLLHSFQVARTEAIKRSPNAGNSGNVVMCGAVDASAANPVCSFGLGATAGWIVFVDANNDWQASGGALEPILERHPQPDPSINIRGDGNAIQSYNPTGFANLAGARVPTRNIVLCDSRGNAPIGVNSTARAIFITTTGRSRVSSLQADVNTALAAIGTTCP
jgi:type IV fimbrial biogenesis protein FimT